MSCSQKVDKDSRVGILEQSMGARNHPWHRVVVPARQAKYVGWRPAGRYHNPTTARSPAHTDCRKIPAPQCAQAISHLTQNKIQTVTINLAQCVRSILTSLFHCYDICGLPWTTAIEW
jgi:hypothetical protein